MLNDSQLDNLMEAIELVLAKNRSSLSVAEISILEEAIRTISVEKSNYHNKRKMEKLTSDVVKLLLRFLVDPEILEGMGEWIEGLLR